MCVCLSEEYKAYFHGLLDQHISSESDTKK